MCRELKKNQMHLNVQDGEEGWLLIREKWLLIYPFPTHDDIKKLREITREEDGGWHRNRAPLIVTRGAEHGCNLTEAVLNFFGLLSHIRALFVICTRKRTLN